MKSTYRRGNIDAQRKVLVLAGIIIASVFILLVPPVRNFFSSVVYSIAPKVWGLGGNTGNFVGSFLGGFHNSNALTIENKNLREQIAQMETQVLDRNLLEEKVAGLEESLGRIHVDNHVSAQVVSGPGKSPYDTLVIDAGTDQGISVNDTVVYVNSGVIGKIFEVYPGSSKVKLSSSPGEEIPVLLGTQAIPCLALGRGMGNFESKVPQGSNLVVGEYVTLPGQSLVLGVIGAIVEKPVEPFVHVFFRTSFNIAKIRSVEVIISKR